MAEVKSFIVKSKSSVKLVVIIVLALTLSLSFYQFIYKPRHHKQGISAFIESGQKRYSQVADQALKEKDYSGYQAFQLSYAESYLSAKDYKSAAAVLSSIQKNVPTSQWTTRTYLALLQLAQHDSDTAKIETLTKALIQKYEQLGNKQAADYYRTQLTKAKKTNE